MDTPPVLPPPLPAPRAGGAAQSTLLKLFAIGVLVALLWGCLQLIDGVRRDRLAVRDEVRAAVAQSWGGEQLLAGPVLVVPVLAPPAGDAAKPAATVRYFLPAELDAEGELRPTVLARGLFTVPVYEARLRLRGRFQPADLAEAAAGATLAWDRAQLHVGLTRAAALRATPVVRWNGGADATVRAITGEKAGDDALVAAAPLAGDARAEAAEFSVELEVRGSRGFALALLGAQSRARLSSPWADPSFGGGVAPFERTVGPEGFNARWESAAFGRRLPRSWTNLDAAVVANRAALEGEALQVSLLQPVDAYRLVERALKYGLLFLVLVFAVFFLFEATGARRLHPVQYLMVGAALVLFFLGYLALGEVVAAPVAYAVAAAASTALVTAYSAGALRSGARSAVVGASLGATYGYLYFVLQLEDYALLGGTAALFALLAVAMWVTRKMDWYGRDETAARGA